MECTNCLDWFMKLLTYPTLIPSHQYPCEVAWCTEQNISMSCVAGSHDAKLWALLCSYPKVYNHFHSAVLGTTNWQVQVLSSCTHPTSHKDCTEVVSSEYGPYLYPVLHMPLTKIPTSQQTQIRLHPLTSS